MVLLPEAVSIACTRIALGTMITIHDLVIVVLAPVA